MGAVWGNQGAKDGAWEDQSEGQESLEGKLLLSDNYILKILMKRKVPNLENIKNACREPLAVTTEVNPMPCAIWDPGSEDKAKSLSLVSHCRESSCPANTRTHTDLLPGLQKVIRWEILLSNIQLLEFQVL